jgi:hypothetical protein
MEECQVLDDIEARKEDRTPVFTTSNSDYHSETRYREYLENEGCDGPEKLRNCIGELDNTESNYEVEV